MPYAGIAQGNTTNASDCNVFYNGLKARYGASNVLAAGFTVGSDTVDMDEIATEANFKAARGAHVLYWSSHGSSYPKLNAGGPKEFNSGDAAYTSWGDPSNPLKVAIFAACYQFDGNANRSRWANNVMRRSDLRVMAGYHEKGPAHPIDRDIATQYFALANEGNSVWYSWQHANAISTKGKDWLVLVYNGEGRQYYRMPEFPGKTYPAPNRSSTSIYRYGGTISSQEVAKSTRVLSSASVPYCLEIDDKVCSLPRVSEKNLGRSICIDHETGAMFYGGRENLAEHVAGEKARAYNEELLAAIIDKALVDTAYIDSYDTTMAEVLMDGEEEGPETTIGATQRLFQQRDGIILEGNCIVSSSDAKGVIAFSNRWQSTKAAKVVDHIDLAHHDLSLMSMALSRKFSAYEGHSTLTMAEPVYIRIGKRYVLHYEVEDFVGRRMLIDAKCVD